MTLIWSLDGSLRYLPVSALWDGKRYLVERYRNVVITLTSRTRISSVPRTQWRGLGLGVSEAKEVFDPHINDNLRFAPLPAVREELRNVIREKGTSDRGVVPGRILLDSKFTQPAMMNELRSRKFSLVHIASHFVFKPGDERDSFLLLGDGNVMTLQQMRNAAELQFAGVDLLTLSACDTAMGGTGGDGKEIEGFAVLAQEQGAKAVLATLWPVSDRSTQLLMTELYRQRQMYRVSKAEALRRAQLKFIMEKMKSPDSLGSRSVGVSVREVEKKYAHPFFWAPFILIGNWR
jgi:CHAT domain-containing protein